MDTPIDPLSIHGLSTVNLDGERPTAVGMPSVERGRYGYVEGSAKAYKMYSRNYLWDSDRWEQEYKDYASRTHCVDANNDGFMDALWDMFQDCINREQRRYSVKQAQDKLVSELGPREFTLTYSPAWYNDDASAQDAMRVAIDKLTRYYKSAINEFRAVGEYTKAGRSHVHCYYLLDKGLKITDKNFKRAWHH